MKLKGKSRLISVEQFFEKPGINGNCSKWRSVIARYWHLFVRANTGIVTTLAAKYVKSGFGLLYSEEDFDTIVELEGLVV